MAAKPDSTNPQTDLSSLCLAVTEHAPLPIATVDGATHIVRYVNPAFCRMMNEPADQLVGNPLSELLPEKDECIQLLDRVFLNQRHESYTEHDASNPHPVFWSYTMWPVLADELLVGIMIQVTETAQFHGMTVAMNEALLLGSVRQHELTESAEHLNTRLRAEIAERLEIEQRLSTSETRYRRLFEETHDGVLILDAKTRKILDANPFIMKLLEYTRSELVGKELWEIGLLKDKDASRKAFQELKEKGLIRYESLPLQTKTGRRREVEFVSNLYQENGDAAIQCNIRDITNRKRTEKKLAERARLLDLSNDAIIVRDLAGRILYWNHGAEELYGWSRDEALGKVINSLLHTDFEGAEKKIAEDLDRDDRWSGELVHTNRGGQRLTVLVRKALDRDSLGNPIAVMESITDITERKFAEEALRASDERFRTLFELGPVAVYSCDAAGVIQEFNRRAEELWGRRPEVGDTDEHFCGSFKMFRTDGTLMPHEQCPMAEVVAGKLSSVHDAEVLIERPDGSTVSVIANIRPLKNERGEVIGAINCFYDISERKRYEHEREALLANEQALRIESDAANRSKDIFLATLSHEMRTPLNAILGWASIIGRADCTPEEVQEGIFIIERNVNAQAQLINDVLDVSRIVSGKLQLEIVPAELAVLIKDAVDVVRSAAVAKNIQIKIDLGPVAAPIPCDPHRIRQILWNLLTNSVKFTPKDGTVTLKLSQDRSSARIEIGDNGQGIPADLLPYVFERFRQGEGGTKRQHGGLGLGLSIVKNLIELHGGEISVKSEGAGRGALFTINLPIPATPLELSPDTPKPAEPPRLDGLRILIVDDEPDARNLLVKVLKDVGAIAVAAGSVVEALRLIETAPPQILLSDIAMPVQDGYDLIRLVRKSGHLAKELPAVAITAFVHKDDVRQTLLAGFQMHVAKPIDPYDLITVIASLAGRTGVNS
jgi:PAS domain S-box-containing protein